MKTKLLLLSVMLTALATSAPSAHAVQTATLGGKIYSIYFISQRDILRSDVAFVEPGAMVFLDRTGNGFYASVTRNFFGWYWTLNQIFDEKRGDLMFFMAGRNNDPFIFGTGFILMDYRVAYPIIFWGVRTVRP